jgi:hypothetical protein
MCRDGIFLLKERENWLGICEVLTAAVIPLTPNFQYLFGFAKRDVFREPIFHG